VFHWYRPPDKLKIQTKREFGGQQIGGLRGEIRKRQTERIRCCREGESTKIISRLMIKATISARRAGGLVAGRIIATITKAGNKRQIPIFWMFLLSINITKPAFVYLEKILQA
jgi:hypothetical protein